MSGSTLPLPGFSLPDETEAAGFELPEGPHKAPRRPQAAPGEPQAGQAEQSAPGGRYDVLGGQIWVCLACETEFIGPPPCEHCGSSNGVPEAEYEPPEFEPAPLSLPERIRELDAEIAYQANYYKAARRDVVERLALLKDLGRRVGALRRQSKRPVKLKRLA